MTTLVQQAPVVGIDGCRGGWIVASRSGVHVVPDLLAATRHIPLAGIDMPIGLPEKWTREADRAARIFLGSRRSTIFDTVPRPLLDAATWVDANTRSRALYGRGISRQSWSLADKIREVDRCIEPDAPHLVEVHPECSFACMTGAPLVSKHTAIGIELRESALRERFGDLPATPAGARRDDLLDAYAVLWSTERFARNEHVTFGDNERDTRNLTMRIVA